MSVKQDYYQALGLSRDASPEEVKAAYRKLARQYHPDVNSGHPDSEERFKEIGEAYAILSDPEKRRKYDAYGHAGLRDDAPGGFAGGMGGDAFDTLFDLFFEAAGQRGGRSAAAQGGVDGQDLRADIQLTLEEVMTGAQKTVELMREAACDTCGGSGAKPGTVVEPCSRCRGAGQVRQTQSTFLGSFSSVRPCPACGGSGVTIPQPCGDCRGSGRQRKKAQTTVEIPAGVESGMQMRLAGQGDAGARGGQPGDLFIVLNVRPHEQFERRGADLICEWDVTVAQAALGATIEVPTFGDSVTLKIPPGAQSGTVFTLKAHGLPKLQGRGMGDLHVAVNVAIPTHLSPDQRQVYELLRRMEQGELFDTRLPDKGEVGGAEFSHPAGLFDKIRDFLSGG